MDENKPDQPNFRRFTSVIRALLPAILGPAWGTLFFPRRGMV
jgi:hypothetical protein